MFLPLRSLTMITADGLLGGHADFLHWGVVQISLANLAVIVLMLFVFALALAMSFPRGHDDDEQGLSEEPHVHG